VCKQRSRHLSGPIMCAPTRIRPKKDRSTVQPLPLRRGASRLSLSLRTWVSLLVNSRFPLVSATESRSQRKAVHGVPAPLLPKLRGHFAEFLNHSYLVRLGMLYLTTCVGLGYGPCVCSLEAFLGSRGSPNSPQSAMHHLSGL